MSSFSEEAEEAHNNSRTAYNSSNTVLEHTKEGSSLMERSTAQMEKIDQIIYESVQVEVSEPFRITYPSSRQTVRK